MVSELWERLDPQELLFASYLKKKHALSSKPFTNKKQSKNENTDESFGEDMIQVPASQIHHRHHHWWMKHNDTVYWCVLRRGQFSYYKTRDEHEAVNVIPRTKILNIRVVPEECKLFLYTEEKTLRFKVESQELLQKWTYAFNEFFGNKKQRTGDSKDSSGRPSRKNSTREPAGTRADITEEEEDEEEEEFEILVNSKNGKPISCTTGTNSCAKKHSMFNISNTDKEFYDTYDPRKPERFITKGIIYAFVKTRFNITKWKKVRAELTNKTFKIYSNKKSKLKRSIPLSRVIDCLDIENATLDPLFALITIDERMEFRAFNEKDMVEWIIAFKSVVLIRKKLAS